MLKYPTRNTERETRNQIAFPVCFFLLLCLSCQPPATEPQVTEAVPRFALELPERPNILWLVAEDLGPYISPFGDSTAYTPNLDRLAAQGVSFDHFYSPSGVCAPSRAAIATGMYPTHIGANHMRTGPWYAGDVPEKRIKEYTARALPPGLTSYDAIPPPEVKMMSEVLRRAGYYCTNNAKQDYQFRKPVTAWDESSREAHWRKRATGQPFFSVFNFEVTHESRIWNKAEDSLWIDPSKPIPIPPYLPDTEVGQKDVRRMYSNIMEMDHQVGEILDQLEEDGELENTVIFWYTDHGGPLPRMKRLLYDSGIKVPMIIRFPGQQLAGSRNDDLLSFIDFAPTVMSLAGIEPPSHLDGQAFLGDFQVTENRKYIHAAADRFDETYDTNRAVRDKQFKYIRYYQPDKSMFLQVNYRDQMAIMQELYRLRDAGELTPEQALWFRETKPEEELFDVSQDPHELNNLAADLAYAEKLLELRTECERWVTAINDRNIIPEEELFAQLWPDGTQPITEDPIMENVDGKLSISCATEGASIGYQLLEEGEASEVWSVYTEPVEVDSSKTLNAIAHRIGYKPSGVVVSAF